MSSKETATIRDIADDPRHSGRTVPGHQEMTSLPLPLPRIADAGPGLIVDLFAGGGGASEGIRMALGRDPDIAINHDPVAVAMHRINHPGTVHYTQDVWAVPPRWAVRGRKVALLWASPDCTHFSKAKGAAPDRCEKRRDLAWVVEKWAREVRPAVICLENVEEFTTWGPLAGGVPIKAQAGTTFRAWVASLRRLGYSVQWRELRACDYGAPTIRKRLFLVARCDDRPIAWPEPTHGDPRCEAVTSGRLLPWRTAAECIDWSIPCPSIFERARPLAENTLRRIAEGIRRYVLESAEPFVVNLTHGGRLESATEPLRTITCANSGEKAIVAPALVQTGYGERQGQAPRALDIARPLGTVVAGGQKHALVSAFLAKHFTGVVGSDLRTPAPTVTTIDHNALVVAHLQRDFGASVGHSADAPCGTVTAGGGGKTGLVTSHLVKLRGTCRHGQDQREPMPTVTAGGLHVGEVRAFLTKYYGQGGQWQSPADPLHTIPTKDRMGLVTVMVRGQPCVIADIGMRMLQPRELFRAQGFRDEYVIDIEIGGRPISKAAQVRLCGNSVCPPMAAAIVAANVETTARAGEVG